LLFHFRLLSSGYAIPLPGRGNQPTLFDIVHDENELLFVVAVENLDVHARLSHAACEVAKLTGLVLP